MNGAVESDERLLMLRSVHLENFRCFGEFLLSFNTNGRCLYRYANEGETPERCQVGPLTVLLAKNGKGKTTVLDSIRILLHPYVNEFIKGASVHAYASDLHIVEDESSGHLEEVDALRVGAYVEMLGNVVPCSRTLLNGGRKTTTKDVGDLLDFAVSIRDARKVRRENQPWPLVAFYGTGRLWATKKGQNRSDLTKTDIFGYEGCLEQVHDFRSVRDWLTKAVKKVRQEKTESLKPDLRVAEQYEVVRNALSLVLQEEGYMAELSVNVDTDELDILSLTPRGRVHVPVSGLSDGVKAVFSLVADIALRCARLNPCYRTDAARLTEGVVMIDEVDLHLHPSWQQVILSTLQRAFPRLQFIVTTHSPQVVSSVPRECVRILTEDGGCSLAEIPTEGSTSAEILTDVFGVSARIPAEISEVTHLIGRYGRLLDEGRWDSEEGVACWGRLKELIPMTPIISELEMERHMRAYERAHPDEDNS